MSSIYHIYYVWALEQWPKHSRILESENRREKEGEWKRGETWARRKGRKGKWEKEEREEVGRKGSWAMR